MSSLKKFSKKMLKNQRGQGMIEYVLLVVIVIGLIVMFKEPIKTKFGEIMGDLDGKIGEVLN